MQLDLGAELIHGDETSLYRLAQEKGWEMEELISLAQGDGGPMPAESNEGFGLFYLGGEKRMLAMDSKVQPNASSCREEFYLCVAYQVDERQISSTSVARNGTGRVLVEWQHK